MNIPRLIFMVLTMAGITYLIRALPLAFFRHKIRSRYLRSLLFYLPYAVLSAMTIPAILYATNSMLSAAVGTGAAVLLAWRKKSLLTVALCACCAVLIIELIQKAVGS